MEEFSMGIVRTKVFMGLASKDIRDNDVNAAAVSKVRPVYLVEMTKNIKVTNGDKQVVLFARS